MALVCRCQAAYLGRIRRENSVSDGRSVGPSGCHMSPLELLVPRSLLPLPLKVVAKTRAGGSLSFLHFTLRRNQEGSHSQRQLKASSNTSDSAENSLLGARNCERVANGMIGTMSFTHQEENFDDDNSNQDDTNGKFPESTAINYERSDSKDIPTNGSASAFVVNRVTLPAGLGDSSIPKVANASELSGWSMTQRAGSSGNREDVLQEFFQAEEDGCVSLVWEAGTEIERVTNDMALPQDRKDIMDQKLGRVVEEEEHGLKRLRELQDILATFPESEADLNVREAELLAFSEKLLNESATNREAYERSQEALSTADEMVSHLNAQVGQLNDEIASRDTLMRLLQKEATLSSQSLQRAAESLADAERRIRDLERRVQIGEDSLQEERDKAASAVRSAALLEQAVRAADSQVVALTAEMSSLKALATSGKRAEQLSAQVDALKEELKARDMLLLEIKEETKRSTEALKMATKIKQDLNATRQREVQLIQALESANAQVKELQTEAVQNIRSLRAEQAQKQTEKMLQDAKLELGLLRKGVEERNKAIYSMKDEVDRNMEILGRAARDREELNAVKLQMQELKAELVSKDAKLTVIREEMASIINLARQKEGDVLKKPSSKRVSSPAASSASSLSVQVPKLMKKPRSRKQTGREGKSGSSSKSP